MDHQPVSAHYPFIYHDNSVDFFPIFSFYEVSSNCENREDVAMGILWRPAPG